MDYSHAPDLLMALEDLELDVERDFYQVVDQYHAKSSEPFGQLRSQPGPKIPEAISERLTLAEERYVCAGIWSGVKRPFPSLAQAVDFYIQEGKKNCRSHTPRVNGEQIRPLQWSFPPLDRAFAHAMIATTKSEFVDLCERIAVMIAHLPERHPETERFRVLLSLEPRY